VGLEDVVIANDRRIEVAAEELMIFLGWL